MRCSGRLRGASRLGWLTMNLRQRNSQFASKAAPLSRVSAAHDAGAHIARADGVRITSSIDRGNIPRIQSHFRIALRCVISAVLISPAYAGAASPPAIAPAAMPRIGTVDQRFQSYNIEMVEITGGRFWKPFQTKPGAEPAQTPRSGSDTPPGKDSRLYQY